MKLTRSTDTRYKTNLDDENPDEFVDEEASFKKKTPGSTKGASLKPTVVGTATMSRFQATRFSPTAWSDIVAPPTQVPELLIKHKFASPIMCSCTIANGGGARAHFFILTISREAPESMMVTDGKGKLLHVSKAVADDLGYPVVDLLGELAENVWDIILPEPFNNLHHAHISHELPMSSPSFSCRTGLSVCLLANTDEGLKPKPYKIKVKSRRLDKTGESANIVTIQPSSMEQAMDERRLLLKMNQSGIVTKVGASPESLFGFNPSEMLGKPISSFVDIFSSDEAIAASNADATK